MEQKYHEEEKFEKIDFTETPMAKGAYEGCLFSRCDLSNADLSAIKFMECEFDGCNMSMAKLTNTLFRDVKFKDSKMLGLQFENCSDLLLSVSFNSCNLGHSSFYKVPLHKTIFADCLLHGIDFSESDLSGSVFKNCDFAGAIFDNTNLEKTDFRTSLNYAIDPERNRIRKGTFSLPEVLGLLGKHDIEIA